jgi:hypothetical protein
LLGEHAMYGAMFGDLEETTTLVFGELANE